MRKARPRNKWPPASPARRELRVRIDVPASSSYAAMACMPAPAAMRRKTGMGGIAERIGDRAQRDGCGRSASGDQRGRVARAVAGVDRTALAQPGEHIDRGQLPWLADSARVMSL